MYQENKTEVPAKSWRHGEASFSTSSAAAAAASQFRFLLHKREKESRKERKGFGFSAAGGVGGISSSRRMGNAVDIVKFQVFLKQSIYCVTLNPGVTLRPLSFSQGVTLRSQLTQVKVLILGCFTAC